MAREMNHADFQSKILQPARGFETKQSAANHRGHLDAFALRPLGDLTAVFERAEHEHARLQRAVGHCRSIHRRNEGAASRGDDQLVVRHRRTIGPIDQTCATQQSGSTLPGKQADVVLLVPGQRIEENFLFLIRSIEDVGQQDAIVVARRFITEHGDIELVGATALEDLLDGARACHSIAYDYQPFFRHDLCNLHKASVQHQRSGNTGGRGQQHFHLRRGR